MARSITFASSGTLPGHDRSCRDAKTVSGMFVNLRLSAR